MRMYAKDFGVVAHTYVEKNLRALFAACQKDSANKTVVFEPGDYLIRSRECEEEILYITNTCGVKEFSKGETPHLNRTPIHIKGVKNLTVEGNGARFIIDGKVTNAVMEDCENIEIKNIEFITKKPDMHACTVQNKTFGFVDFKIDAETDYKVENGRLYFYGTDYCYDPIKKYKTAYWTACIKKDEPNTVFRVPAVFMGAYRVREIAKRTVRIYTARTAQFSVGDTFYLYDGRRQYAGIFASRCTNVKLAGITQRFNYSLAFVAQDCRNIEITSATFSPERGGRLLASAADFIQLCMCRGEIRVTDSYFDGAGDDCLNIHGMHLKIKKIDGNKVTAAYMHPQSHGYNAFHADDEIAFINPKTLLEEGRATLLQSEMQGPFQILLTFSGNIEKRFLHGCVENVSASASLYFARNTVKRIITRGVLATTRGKVLLKDNHFESTSMSGVLLSDDAKTWYESSMCCDVTIQNNRFDYCGGVPILILPENSVHAGAVHKNIKITGNVFGSYKVYCIKAKSADNIEICANRFCREEKKLTTKNCSHVRADFDY